MQEPIFELLKRLRMSAMKDKNWGVLRAVEKAENAAMEEICGVDLRSVDTGYDAVLAEVFPSIERKAKFDA